MRFTVLLWAGLGLGLSGAASGGISGIAPDDSSHPNIENIASVISSSVKGFSSGGTGPEPLTDLLNNLKKEISPSGPAPVDTIEKAFDVIQVKFSGQGRKTIIDSAANLAGSGLVSTKSLDSLSTCAGSDVDSHAYENGKAPDIPIYPSKSPNDAPYSLDEIALRSAIHFPDAFEYCQGEKKPVILVPGTSVPARVGFNSTLAKLLAATTYADPLWINIPNASHGDIQINSEYVAYAINYVSAICQGHNVSVITWSQGSINTQWSLKYWPSTRDVVEDFIAISPDFGGTILAEFICPPLQLALFCTPAFAQQASKSTFLDVLRSNGGDSAYVPTTTIYSAFDDIVQPMSGLLASGLMRDERNIGVTNNEMQEVCFGRPAGGIYTHTTSLINPLTWALIQDALLNPGPGNTERIGHLEKGVCNKFIPDELDIDDFFDTVGLIFIFLGEAVKYTEKTNVEPAIKDYAKI
ncbi:hypothetical protein EMPG_11600 [Blastomyces silverae]|uniref:Lipase B n=1 Tax=Blastomyces silverae TaxID=2060906 RepID=A0A0H1BPJ5_9EURO|nr:hypothetical protein EMPG_11600 [Blastomyces silverae]